VISFEQCEIMPGVSTFKGKNSIVRQARHYQRRVHDLGLDWVKEWSVLNWSQSFVQWYDGVIKAL